MILRTILFTCIVLGLSFGVLSCTFFLWNWLVGTPPGGILLAGILGGVALAAALFRPVVRHKPMVAASRSSWPALLFLAACLYAGWLSVIEYLRHPHGEWDAWAIWNLHARFLYRGGEHWSSLFSESLYWTHPDYPFLLPSLVASGWTLVGSETPAVPGLIAILFTFGTIVLLVTSVSFHWNDGRGLAAGLILLATPGFFLNGMYQHADVPLGFFILLTMVLLYLNDRLETDGTPLFLAGLSAGFAAWTKNEGLLFVVTLFAARLIVGALHKPRSVLRREVQILSLGLAPVLSIILAFKFLLSPANDIMSDADMFAVRLTDASRYVEIGRFFAKGIAEFGAALVSPLIAVAVYILYARRRTSLSSTTQLSATAVLIFVLLGYYLVYLISPHNLQWYLSASFERLLFHMWPSFVFCIACIGLSLRPTRPAITVPLVTGKPQWLRPAVGGVSVTLIVVSITMLSLRGRVPSAPQPQLRSSGLSGDAIPVRIQGRPASIEIAEQPTSLSGYSRFEAGQFAARVSGLTLLGYRRGRDRVAESVVPAPALIRSGVIPFRRGGGYRTSIAILNSNKSPTDVVVSVKQQQHSFSLPANGQISVFLDEPPFNISARAGVLVFQSSLPVVATAFLTFQNEDSPFLMANLPIANPDSREDRPTHIPYVLRDADWSTELVMLNPTGGSMTGHHRWYDDSGGLVSERPYSIPARTSVIHRVANKSSASHTGRIEIVPDVNQMTPYGIAVLLLRHERQPSLVIVSAANALRGATLYAELSPSVETDIAIANPSRSPLVVQVGSKFAKGGFEVPGGGVLTLPVRNLPQFNASNRAIVHMVASAPVAVTGLRALLGNGNRRLITAYPAARQGGLIFPQFAAGGQFTSEFVLFSSMATPLSGLLRFFNSSGGPLRLSVIEK